MTSALAPIRKLKKAILYFGLFLIVLFCIYTSLNTITLFLWGDPSLHGEPRMFHPPQIIILHYFSMISPAFGRFIVTLLFWGCGIFTWLGFRQVTRKSSLDHPLRDQIVSFIRSHPGCHFSSIVQESGINRGTLFYHLDRLKTLGLVHESKDGGLTRYFANEPVMPALEQKILIHRDNTVRSRILSMLEPETDTSRSALKKRLDISGPALWYHMQMLVRDGIVLAKQERGKVGRPVMYSLTPDAAGIVTRERWGTLAIAGSPDHVSGFSGDERGSGTDPGIRV